MAQRRVSSLTNSEASSEANSEVFYRSKLHGGNDYMRQRYGFDFPEADGVIPNGRRRRTNDSSAAQSASSSSNFSPPPPPPPLPPTQSRRFPTVNKDRNSQNTSTLNASGRPSTDVRGKDEEAQKTSAKRLSVGHRTVNLVEAKLRRNSRQDENGGDVEDWQAQMWKKIVLACVLLALLYWLITNLLTTPHPPLRPSAKPERCDQIPVKLSVGLLTPPDNVRKSLEHIFDDLADPEDPTLKRAVEEVRSLAQNMEEARKMEGSLKSHLGSTAICNMQIVIRQNLPLPHQALLSDLTVAQLNHNRTLGLADATVSGLTTWQDWLGIQVATSRRTLSMRTRDARDQVYRPLSPEQGRRDRAEHEQVQTRHDHLSQALRKMNAVVSVAHTELERRKNVARLLQNLVRVAQGRNGEDPLRPRSYITVNNGLRILVQDFFRQELSGIFLRLCDETVADVASQYLAPRS